MDDLETKIAPEMAARIKVLMSNPKAGTEFSGGDYSNCHGTATYVFNIDHPRIRAASRPVFLSKTSMQRLIDKHFSPAEKPRAGCLIAFYDSDRQRLLHTAVSLGELGELFHQPDTGLPFEFSTVQRYYEEHLSYGGFRVDVMAFCRPALR